MSKLVTYHNAILLVGWEEPVNLCQVQLLVQLAVVQVGPDGAIHLEWIYVYIYTTHIEIHWRLQKKYITLRLMLLVWSSNLQVRSLSFYLSISLSLSICISVSLSIAVCLCVSFSLSLSFTHTYTHYLSLFPTLHSGSLDQLKDLRGLEGCGTCLRIICLSCSV